MRQAVIVAGAVALIVIATIFQMGILDRYLLLGAQVQLPVVVVCCLALVSRPAAGGALGLLSGVLTGALSGATLTHYALGRILAGYFLGTKSETPQSLSSAGLWCAAGTLISQGILLLLAPPPAIGPAVGATILTAVYNGVAAIPVFALIGGLFQPKVV
jgi:hypothetical protein